MKLIWHSYPVLSLDKCAHIKFSLRLFLRTRMMIDGIQLPLSAWLSCTTLGDSTNAMIVMATTNSALAPPGETSSQILFGACLMPAGSYGLWLPCDACLAKLI